MANVEDISVLENQLQNFLMQKQAFQIELNEIENALAELKKSDDEVYKIVSGIMIKAEKNVLEKELVEKKKLAEMRISSIEKQEKLAEKNILQLRKEIMGKK